MCHVIVTCRSMLWTLLSIVVAFAELVAFMSPDWLVKPLLTDNDVTQTKANDRESLGLYSRCKRIGGEISCGNYAGTFGEVGSKFWQAAMLFLAAGMLVLGCVACISVFTLCFQSIKKKSIFNICGLLQAIGGKEDVLVLLNLAVCLNIPHKLCPG
uniref:LHFPL tetraspan subfamily member 2b n=1 Tax=Poecilia mexicana TaxID=48701 RepID=A0A3B3WXK6_9TELE